MSATSPLGKADTLQGRPDVWSGLGWLLVVAAVCGIADAMALPDASVWLGMPMSGHEMFRPEWLVAGTLAAIPLYRLGRASLSLGVLGFLLTSGQVFTIVDNARERYVHNAQLYGFGPDFPKLIFYGLAAVQTVVFLVAVSKGMRLRWADRRFAAMMRKNMAAARANTSLEAPRSPVAD
jgi:hypothetical protein